MSSAVDDADSAIRIHQETVGLHADALPVGAMEVLGEVVDVDAQARRVGEALSGVRARTVTYRSVFQRLLSRLFRLKAGGSSAKVICTNSLYNN